VADTVLDALELELRQLPGVVGVGLDDTGEAVVVHLFVSPHDPPGDLRRRASEVGRSHLEGPVVIEIEAAAATGTSAIAAVGTSPARVRLLAVRIDEAEGEVEVHLAYGGSRTVGRGQAASSNGSVAATLEALGSLGMSLPYRPKAVATVAVGLDHIVVVSLEAENGSPDRMGVAQAATNEESAARATLHALNRLLSAEGAFRGQRG
jgi:hypothetical protein